MYIVTFCFRYIWEVPVWYKTDKTDDTMAWLVNKSISVSVPSDVNWVILNTNARGFYRVNYETDNWYKIIDTLLNDHTVFSKVDRMKIIDDLTSLSQ